MAIRYILKRKPVVRSFYCAMAKTNVSGCNMTCMNCVVPFSERNECVFGTTVVNADHEEYDVLIDRTTKWGNKFKEGVDGDRPQVIRLYREWILNQPRLLHALDELKGKKLGCHCKPQICHGDVLVELIEKWAQRLVVEPRAKF